MLLSSLAAWERRARAFECARGMGVVGDTGEEEWDVVADLVGDGERDADGEDEPVAEAELDDEDEPDAEAELVDDAELVAETELVNEAAPVADDVAALVGDRDCETDAVAVVVGDVVPVGELVTDGPGANATLWYSTLADEGPKIEVHTPV